MPILEAVTWSRPGQTGEPYSFSFCQHRGHILSLHLIAGPSSEDTMGLRGTVENADHVRLATATGGSTSSTIDEHELLQSLKLPETP